MPKVNLPEILDLEAWIEQQATGPRADCEWYQRAYQIAAASLQRNCGTAYCAAGRTVVKHGAVFMRESSNCLAVEPDDDRRDVFRYDAGETDGESDRYAVSTHDRAKRILGLTGEEARDLFHGFNELADMRVVFADIKARARHEETIDA